MYPPRRKLRWKSTESPKRWKNNLLATQVYLAGAGALALPIYLFILCSFWIPYNPFNFAEMALNHMKMLHSRCIKKWWMKNFLYLSLKVLYVTLALHLKPYSQNSAPSWKYWFLWDYMSNFFLNTLCLRCASLLLIKFL